MAETSTGKHKRKKSSLSSLLMTMKPTSEELKYRKTKLNEKNIRDKSINFLKCTKCRKNYTDAINNGEKISQHPFLGVLMCEKCCEFYGDGNFSLGSDDEDKYCRWCGEGGMLFSCSKCIYGFCFNCVKRHFGNDGFKKIEKDDNWLCFFCNPKPLWELRFYSSLAEQVSELSENSPTNESLKNKIKESSLPEQQNERKSSPIQNQENVINKTKIQQKKKRRRIKNKDFFTSSDESDTEEIKMKNKVPVEMFCSTPIEKRSSVKSSFPLVLSQVKEKVEKVLKLTKYQFGLGVNWSTKSLTKLTDSDKITCNDLINECNSIKSYLSTLSSNLMTFYNTIDSIETMLPKEENASKTYLETHSTCNDVSSYPIVLNFLNFVNNQVKMFMEKGIPFEDLMNSEVYDSDQVLGIKKKFNILSVKPTTLTQNNVTETKNNKNDKNGNSSDNSATEMSEVEKDKARKRRAEKMCANVLGVESSHSKDSVMEILSILENA